MPQAIRAQLENRLYLESMKQKVGTSCPAPSKQTATTLPEKFLGQVVTSVESKEELQGSQTSLPPFEQSSRVNLAPWQQSLLHVIVAPSLLMSQADFALPSQKSWLRFQAAT